MRDPKPAPQWISDSTARGRMAAPGRGGPAGGFSGNPWAFFHRLVNGQRAEYAAFIEMDEIVICSASPELFFQLSDGRIRSRPMKGTARRGRTFAEDARQAEAYTRSGFSSPVKALMKSNQ